MNAKSFTLRAFGRLPEKLMLCLVLGGAVGQSLQAQPTETSAPVYGPTVSGLKDALDYLSRKYNFRFSYEEGLVASYRVSYSYGKEKDGVEGLRTILRQTDLSFEQKGNTIVLFKKATPRPSAQPLAATTIKSHDFSGVITGDKSEPLAGATIQVTGTTRIIQTDDKGQFHIHLDAEAERIELTISMTGYEPMVYKAEAGKDLHIVLKSLHAEIEPVVVIGYGSQKKSVVSGGITEVQLDQLSSRSENNIGDVLQGKAPGVVVTQEGGDPTSAPSIFIRGLGGINGESALYVVDGSIVTGTPVINPNEIASISVLKDASASIYGARASGGVILITTKKGKKDESTVTLDAKFGEQSAWRKLQPLMPNNLQMPSTRRMKMRFHRYPCRMHSMLRFIRMARYRGPIGSTIFSSTVLSRIIMRLSAEEMRRGITTWALDTAVRTESY
jgi:TonB-dependent SusC/RagA subfamily outer membrane receptor